MPVYEYLCRTCNTHYDKLRPARDADERAAIWKGRKSAFSAVGRLSPDFILS